MKFPAIYLASASPRRRELLSQIAVEHQVVPIDVAEQVLPGESAAVYVERIARAKARAGLAACQQLGWPMRPVLAADTAVVLMDGQILGKPANTEQAGTFLTALSGCQHQVMTCVAVMDKKGQINSLTRISQVHFAPLNTDMIQDYIATGEGLDKAGAYAVQGLAAQFIESISGSYSGIMGLPLYETARLLKQVEPDEQ